MQIFITAAALGAFASAARLVDRLLAVLLVAAAVVFAWRATSGGMSAVDMLLRQIAPFLTEHRELVGGALVGLLVGRPIALLLHPTSRSQET